jgi:pseudouridine-5'-phosphate glycosidase
MHGLRLRADVAVALASGRPVVALESTIISHGLPRPENLAIAHEIEDAVRAAGAVPATVAVLDGQVHIGLDDAGLEELATRPDVVKLSLRDLGTAVATGRCGATTVSATAHLAARAGISVFATGGLGGVHREAAASYDESADLVALARTPVTVVCSGVKSLLDVPATLERLETLGVPVLGYRTDSFPGFYLTDSGERLDWRVETPAQIAAVAAARGTLGLSGALLVVNPVPAEAAMDRALHDRALYEALDAAKVAGVRGKDVTPFLLEHFHAMTRGASVTANIALIRSNAALGGAIALAICARTTR